jgi:hypothetical protein
MPDGALLVKNFGGRPTKYRTAYCDELVRFCGEGYSLTAFAGHLGVCREVLYDWQRTHPEFADAMARARAARLLWWEERLRSLAIAPKASGGAAAAVIFALKNVGPDEFSDTQTHRHIGARAGPIVIRVERVIVDPAPEQPPVIDGEFAERLEDAD